MKGLKRGFVSTSVSGSKTDTERVSGRGAVLIKPTPTGELEVLDWPFYFEDEADSNHMTWRVTIETLAALASSSLYASLAACVYAKAVGVSREVLA